MLNFPDNPSEGQVFYQWRWDGEKWVPIVSEGWAPLHSPDFTGMPTAPTPPPGSNDAKIATTAFVMEAIERHIAGVASFNGRTGHVYLDIVDIIYAGGAPIHSPHFTGWPEAETAEPGTDSRILATTEFVQRAIRERLEVIVETFNGRWGHVELRWDDVEDVGGAPITNPHFFGFAHSQTAPRQDRSNRLATTEFVWRRTDELEDDLEEDIEDLRNNVVLTWNQRKGHVEFRPSDLSAVGGAFLESPHFTGRPTAPTAPPHTWSNQIATTKYVDDAIWSNPGPPGPPGQAGMPGPPGEGFRLKGSVADRDDLPTHGNVPGDTWITEDTGDGWTWTGAVWRNVGPLRGPPGSVTSTVREFPPEDPAQGDFWTSPTGTYVRVGDDWRLIPTPNTASASGSLEARPSDDVVTIYSITTAVTFTLPDLDDVPAGKVIRLLIDRVYAGGVITVMVAGQVQPIYWLTASGWQSRFSYDIAGRTPELVSEILFIASFGGGWAAINQGPPIFGDPPLPGLSGVPSFLPFDTSAVIVPTDDVLWAYSVSNDGGTVTLPPLASVPPGKTIRLSAKDFFGPGLYTIATAPGDTLRVLTATGWQGISSYAIPSPPVGIQLLFIATNNSGDGWLMVNQGPPIFGNPPLPGLAGVPSVHIINTAGSYTVQPTDDVIDINLTDTAVFTLTVPASNTMPNGKQFRLVLTLQDTSILTITNGLGGNFFLPQAAPGWRYTNSSFSVPAVVGTELLFVNSSTRNVWTITNAGQPSFGNPPLPGLSGVPNVQRINDASIVVAPTTDLVFYTYLSSAETLTLPNLASVPSGKAIKLIISNTGPSASLAITAAGSDEMSVLAVGGRLEGTGNPITLSNLPRSLDLEITNSGGNGWYIQNQGLPVIAQIPNFGTNYTLAGLSA